MSKKRLLLRFDALLKSNSIKGQTDSQLIKTIAKNKEKIAELKAKIALKLIDEEVSQAMKEAMFCKTSLGGDNWFNLSVLTYDEVRERGLRANAVIYCKYIAFTFDANWCKSQDELLEQTQLKITSEINAEISHIEDENLEIQSRLDQKARG